MGQALRLFVGEIHGRRLYFLIVRDAALRMKLDTACVVLGVIFSSSNGSESSSRSTYTGLLPNIVVAHVLIGLKRQPDQAGLLLFVAMTVPVVLDLDDMIILISRN
jgi:hypothetical protein